MAAYLQMGHNSENLVGEEGLENFHGVILSPVNRYDSELQSDIQSFRDSGIEDIILDPQLYFPRTQRRKLVDQPYFPSNFDSQDYSRISWWNTINRNLDTYASRLLVDKVASPTKIPRLFNNDYYNLTVEVSNNLTNRFNRNHISTLCTVMINIDQIPDEEYLMNMSSILSETDSTGYYIVIVSDINPRLEFSDAEELLGMMKLIHLLKNTGKEIIVSNTSSDMILYKFAGADNCASGKFFNLRRFTTSRFNEPSEGGGQIAYWFEHSLLAYLRDADIRRLQNNDFDHLVGVINSSNPWSEIILSKISDREHANPWLGDSWRHYLSWFCRTENLISRSNTMNRVRNWLREAEANWLSLDDNDILFTETRNNGSWVRPWRQALGDFSRFQKS